MTLNDNVRIAIWVFGIPTIIALLIRAIRQVRAIRKRHEELLAEEFTNPQHAYQALAELYAEPQKQKQKR
jgi:hypothetical protein